jgi:hypothetical protein
MPASQSPPRYSRRAFPAYRYVPGHFPHPTRDPDGHSYGREVSAPQIFDPDRWQDSESYLYGVDLFNNGYWWEAHEAWEACWIAVGRTSTAGLFLQGLIQIAAACLKKYQGHMDGALRLAADGLDKFPAHRQTMLGIEMQPLKTALQDFFAGKKADQPLIHLLQERAPE